MNYEIAEKILKQIETTKIEELKNDFIQRAIKYARIRADWMLTSTEERVEMEELRTRSHNAFIDSCNILSRNMANNGEDVTWRKMLGDDRTVIGDFACFLHCILGIQAR